MLKCLSFALCMIIIIYSCYVHDKKLRIEPFESSNIVKHTDTVLKNAKQLYNQSVALESALDNNTKLLRAQGDQAKDAVKKHTKNYKGPPKQMKNVPTKAEIKAKYKK